jgi:hypothetical protein
MALENILLKVGAPILAKIVGQRFGKDAADIAQVGLEALAEQLGVEPTREAIETAVRANPNEATVAKVVAVEERMPELILAQAERMRAGNDQQRLTNELLLSQQQAGGWKSNWLYAWQWFLMLCWCWTLLLVHILNAALRLAAGDAAGLPAPEVGNLLTLTTLYLGLHMGGHTVLELVRNKWGGAFGAKAEDKPS